MLYLFPDRTFAIAGQDYDRPYPDPIAVESGSVVRPVLDGSMTTDFMGWTWCIARDGRAGWLPDSWCDRQGEAWLLKRDFNALELSVRRGQRLRLLYSESGFIMVEADTGERGWVPDAVLELAHGHSG